MDLQNFARCLRLSLINLPLIHKLFAFKDGELSRVLADATTAAGTFFHGDHKDVYFSLTLHLRQKCTFSEIHV